MTFPASVKSIGFLDEFLDEWHANEFPKMAARAARGAGFRVGSAWAVRDREGGVSNREWCAARGVDWKASAQEVVDASDALMVLAPSHPETHEALAAPALRSGKPVFLDKTMTTTADSARRMFTLAAEHGTPVFSSSALRFSDEVGQARAFLGGTPPAFLATTGAGSIGEYVIHQLEMISAVWPGACYREVLVAGEERRAELLLRGDGVLAAARVAPGLPFTLSVCDASNRGWTSGVIEPAFFERFLDAVLAFFENKQAPVGAAETIQIIGIYEACLAATADPGRWHPIRE